MKKLIETEYEVTLESSEKIELSLISKSFEVHAYKRVVKNFMEHVYDEKMHGFHAFALINSSFYSIFL